MNKRWLAAALSAVMLIGSFSGCNGNKPASTAKKTLEPKPQLVVAANPAVVYDDGTQSVAYNDVKTALKTDREAATLTSLSRADWTWVTLTEDNWKIRSIYGLEAWSNGVGAKATSLNAYAFSDDGTVSLLNYTKNSAQLTTYQNEEIPDAGILFSVGGNNKEALCYVAQCDGIITIPKTSFTAISAVGNIKTGFLAEDGTSRSAVLSIVVNTKTVYESELANSVAGNGTATTQITTPQLNDINVSAGDKIFFTLQLNATVNSAEDITTEDDDKPFNWDNSNSGANSNTDNSSNQSSEVPADDIVGGNISLIDNYESRFTVISGSDASAKTQSIGLTLRGKLESITTVAVTRRFDDSGDRGYEILVGLCDRNEAKSAYDEIVNARTNHAADFIVRMVGKKLVIMASTEMALQNAVDWFLDTYCKGPESSVPADLNYVYRPEMKNVTIGNTNIASFSIRYETYPSYITVLAATDIQNWVMQNTGYYISRGTKSSSHEIVLYATSDSGATADQLKMSASENFASYQELGINGYKIQFDGYRLYVRAGSTTAANQGVQDLLSELDKGTKIANGYTKTGTYQDKAHTLSNTYSLAWNDEFTGDYRNGTKINRNNWSFEASGPRVGSMYYLKNMLSKYKVSTLDEFLSLELPGGPWYTPGTYSVNVLGKTLEFTVPEGQIYGGLYYVSNLADTADSSAFIRENALVQVATTGLSWDRDGLVYSSGVGMTTQKNMNFRRGILEIRSVFNCRGGFSSTIWTKGGEVIADDKKFLEIDLIETFGQENKLEYNLHSWKIGANAGDDDYHIAFKEDGYMSGASSYSSADGSKLYEAYHYYGYEWTEDYWMVLLDGEPVYTVDTTSSTYKKLFECWEELLLSTGVAAEAGYANGRGMAYMYDDLNYIANAREEQLIDFVRIYQKDDGFSRVKSR
ncbi:MAG: family 16 glycosylhydrolase [Acutalibacteraceae bacterium]